MMLTCPCKVDPLTPHFHTEELGVRGYTYFLIYALNILFDFYSDCCDNLLFVHCLSKKKPYRPYVLLSTYPKLNKSSMSMSKT